MYRVYVTNHRSVAQAIFSAACDAHPQELWNFVVEVGEMLRLDIFSQPAREAGP
jgi:hypothetical protein